MGKISKYSNLYDKNGELIRSVNSISGRLEDYSIEELEQLVDELAKDETKRTEYQNSMSILMRMYETKGNPHKDEIIQKLNDYAKSKTTKAEVINALNELNDETGVPTPGEEEEVRRTAEGSAEEPRGEHPSDTDCGTGITA